MRFNSELDAWIINECDGHRYWLEPKICIKCGEFQTWNIENCVIYDVQTIGDRQPSGV